tara:strand:- start:2512 stop:2697 length:186 start_codon:yes stop_codon:yes gene_type:complete
MLPDDPQSAASNPIGQRFFSLNSQKKYLTSIAWEKPDFTHDSRPDGPVDIAQTFQRFRPYY